MAEINTRFSPKIVLGGLNRFGALATPWGDRALLVSDIALEGPGAELQEHLDSWGIESFVYSHANLQDDTYTLEETLSLARGSRARMVIALGGTRVLSLARTTAAAASSVADADEIWSGYGPPNPGIPCLEIPTSGRHPLLFRDQSLLVDSRTARCRLVDLPRDTTRLALIDPGLCLTLPAVPTAHSLGATILHAVEAYLSPQAMVISDVQAREALQRLGLLLGRVITEAGDPDFRLKQNEAALLASLAVGMTSPGPGTLLAWAVAAASGVSRAATAAILLPWILESPLYSGSGKGQEVARLLAPDEEGSLSPAEAVRGQFGRIGLPGRLRQIGTDLQTAIPAASVAADMAGGERKDLDEGTFRDILETAS
jgi:alcohol dehydrogenase class IV